jgi:DNA polymerase III subunit delta'
MKWKKQSGTKSMPFSLDQALGYLCEANAQGRIAHSYLFSGPEGSGKRRLVTGFFRSVNGDLTDQADFHGIEPESKSRKILIEQIRGLESSLRMHARRARVKFGVVYEADRLMPQAANAFLKTLEEPPEHSLLILVTALPEALLETIRSRCIEVSLLAPSARALTEEEAELVGELFRIIATDGFSVGTALKLARVFLAILGNVREKIEKEHSDLLKKDQTAYKQTTDGTWLGEREEHLSALTESRYVKARANLILKITESLGDALRIKHGSPFLDLKDYRAGAASLAGGLSSVELLRRLEALQSLTDYLSRNVQEALAVEVAFLKAFGPVAQKPNGALATERTAR